VGDPNYFASSALLCLPLAYLFSRSMPQRWVRWSCAVSVVLILAAMAVSGSRGGFLGLIAMVLVMIWHSKRRLLTLILVACVGGALLAISPVSPVGRLLHPSASDDGGKAVRLVMWSAAWRMFCDNPVLGVGYGNFRVVAPRYVNQDVGHDFLAHSEYLELLSEMGLPGLLALVGTFVASFVTLHRVRRSAKRCGSRFLINAALGIQTGLIGYAISILFLSAGFLRLSWFMVFISACMPPLVADAAARKRARGKRNRSNTALELEAPVVAVPRQDEERRERWL
jgi:O-antigen ligase